MRIDLMEHKSLTHRRAIALLSLIIACSASNSGSASAAHASNVSASPRRHFLHQFAADSVDSMVLERRYGSRPLYRLRLSQSGATQFVSQLRNDSGRTASGRLAAEDYKELVDFAVIPVDFLSLPDDIYSDSAMCGPVATDEESAIVTIYMPDGSHKSVWDYYGCGWSPWSLRALEDRIDREVHVERMLRPPRHAH